MWAWLAVRASAGLEAYLCASGLASLGVIAADPDVSPPWTMLGLVGLLVTGMIWQMKYQQSQIERLITAQGEQATRQVEAQKAQAERQQAQTDRVVDLMAKKLENQQKLLVILVRIVKPMSAMGDAVVANQHVVAEAYDWFLRQSPLPGPLSGKLMNPKSPKMPQET